MVRDWDRFKDKVRDGVSDRLRDGVRHGVKDRDRE